MHQYLRAVGFSDIKSKTQLKELMNDCLVNPKQKEFYETEAGNVLVECVKTFGDTVGLVLRGEYDEEENLTLDFYYPFAEANNICSYDEVIFERHSDKESFAGVCEDLRIGVSLIYYVQNSLYLMKEMSDKDFSNQNISVGFSALSLGGTIMLPIQKKPEDQLKLQKASIDRNKRIIAAKNGDEEAIEQLTLEDIDIYSAVSKKILTDDIFTLVDSYFMPFGVECDHYSILGEIDNYKLETNKITGENVYVLDLLCNNLAITVCINKKDLLGVPEIGRRFRGNIWLQGQISV